MWVFFRDNNFSQFSATVQTALRGLDPDLLIGEPALYEDDQDRVWLAHSDSRWSQIQVAMLACSLVNVQQLKNLDYPHVQDGEVTDRSVTRRGTRGWNSQLPPPEVVACSCHTQT